MIIEANGVLQSLNDTRIADVRYLTDSMRDMS